jgi:hypothetical protein
LNTLSKKLELIYYDRPLCDLFEDNSSARKRYFVGHFLEIRNGNEKWILSEIKRKDLIILLEGKSPLLNSLIPVDIDMEINIVDVNYRDEEKIKFNILEESKNINLFKYLDCLPKNNFYFFDDEFPEEVHILKNENSLY